jgi:hypothetical protein
MDFLLLFQETLSIGIKKRISGHFRSKLSFSGKTGASEQYRSNHVDQGKKMSFRLFWIKTVIFGQNHVHRVNTSQIVSTKIKNEFRAI